MLIFKKEEEMRASAQYQNFTTTINFNLKLFISGFETIPDLYIVSQNNNIAIEFKFSDIGIEAHFFYDNNTKATFIVAITLEDIKQIAEKEYKLDIDNIATYSNFVNSSWRDHVMTSFKEFIYNKIAAA